MFAKLISTKTIKSERTILEDTGKQSKKKPIKNYQMYRLSSF